MEVPSGMSETEAFNRHLTDLRLKFLAEMRSQYEAPPNNEPVIKAFHEASLYCNVRIPEYQELTNYYIAIEPVPDPSYRLNKYFKAHQSELMRDNMRDKWGYPGTFEDPRQWENFIKAHLTDPEDPVYQGVRDALEKPLQINRASRKAVIAFCAAALQMRNSSSEAPVVHEYGAAAGMVLKSLAMHVINGTEVCRPDGTLDTRASAMFDIITGSVSLGTGYGVEIHPPKTEEDLHRIKAATLDPSRLDRSANANSHEDRFDLIAASRPKQVHLIEDDLMNLSAQNRDVLANNPADIAFISHTLPQLHLPVSEVVDTIRPNVKDRGFIVVNEYASPDPEDPTKLNFPNNWYGARWLCNSLVMPVNKREEGFFTLFNWDTAHCERVKINDEGLGRLALRGFI